MSIGEYLALRLFGRAAVSYSVASWTGLLNRARLTWDEDLLAQLPVEAGQLSALVDIDEPWQGLSGEFARRWPALGEVPWFPAVGDGAAANVGSGCTTSGRLAVTSGSTSALRVLLPGSGPPIPKGLWCYRLDRDHALLGGALSEGGNIFTWLRTTLQLPEGVDFDAELSVRQPDAHGLTFLPLLAGERSPGWAGGLRGAIQGLSLATSPLDILQAGLESVAYRIGLVSQLLSPALPEEPQVIASGGTFIHSPYWVQLIADVLDRPVSVSLVEEASARGAALLALKALGVYESLAKVKVPLGEPFRPDTHRHEIYTQAMQRQQRLYELICQTTQNGIDGDEI
jgi:gluconokinase